MANSNFDLSKTRYTHRDYLSLKEDLINAIPSLTQEWTSREEADPGIVLIKLISMMGDNLSFNIDKMALELYLSTVTQRKNCVRILSLLGYKMHWYRSGRVLSHLRLKKEVDDYGNNNHVVLTPYETTFVADEITYTVISQGIGTGDIDVDSETSSIAVKLVEGTAKTVTFNYNDLVNNRYYFAEENVDESELILHFGVARTYCYLTENLYLVTDDQYVYFEFNVDEYSRPYIELVRYWEDIIGNTARTDKFELTYILSSGSQGNVAANALRTMVGAKVGKSSNLVVDHLSNTVQFNDNEPEDLAESYNQPGYDPQTVEEGRQDAAKYVFTYDTLVTSYDFEKACKRANNITASKLVDNQIIINDNLDAEEIATRADDDFELNPNLVEVKPGQEPQKVLLPYRVIMYLAYLDFEMLYNQYYSRRPSGYKYKTYEDVSEGLIELGYFPYKPTNNISAMVDEVLNGCKIMNVEVMYGTTKLYPFRVAGYLHFTEFMSPQDALTIVREVDEDLREYYYPDRHTYGYKPNFLEIVDVIQSSDTRIRYFDAEGSIVQYSSICDLEKFDTTSFVKYLGLSEDFNIDIKFLKFKIKNLGSTPIELTNLNALREDETEHITINGRKTYEVQLYDIKELQALCDDMEQNVKLSYVSY